MRKGQVSLLIGAALMLLWSISFGQGTSVVGVFETEGAIDGAQFGGPAGLATVRLRLDPKHGGEITIQPADGSAATTRPVTWRFDAKKRVLAVKVAGKRIRDEFEEKDGAIRFAGASWRRPGEGADGATPPGNPEPAAPVEPSAPPTEVTPVPVAPAPVPVPTPPVPATPIPTAPTPAAPTPAAPKPIAPALTKPPASPPPAQPPELPPVGPSRPVPPPAQPIVVAGPAVGMWATHLASEDVLLLQLRGDGQARLALLQGSRVTALRNLGRWSGGTTTVELPLPAGSNRATLQAGRLRWLGMLWRRQ